MSSAIGTFAAQRLALSNTIDVQARAERAQIQLSTGKVARTYDGVAQDARRLLDLERSQTANKAFQQNVKQAKLRLEETSSSVKSLQQIAQRFQQQLVSANTDTNVENLSIKNTAKNFREEIEGLLNTDLAGRHLFSGTKTATQSVEFKNLALGDIASGAHFDGNDEAIEARATENLNVESNVTADPTKATGIQELITATTRVAEADQGDLDGAIDAALDDLNGGKAEVSSSSVADPTDSLKSLFGIGAGAQTLTVQNDKTGDTKTISYQGSDSLREFVSKFNERNPSSPSPPNETSVATARLEESQGGFKVAFQSTSSDPLSFTTDTANLTGGANLNVAEKEREGAIERLASTNSDIGSRINTLKETLDRLESDNSKNETAIGNIENVDVTKAATELSSLQNTLRASFASTSRLQNISILNFLR